MKKQNKIKFYLGGYEITKGLNLEPIHYQDVVALLRFLNVPQTSSYGKTPAYYLNEKQVKLLKKTLEDLCLKLARLHIKYENEKTK